MTKLKKALEKAKVTRESGSGAAPMPHTTPSAPEGMAIEDAVQVNYTQTRVINIDPDILRKNKVISLFHEEKMTDQLKILRTQLLSRLKELDGNSLLVTSANPGEGKTFTAINLAVSIAQELSRTVLLLDADLRPHRAGHHNFSSDFLGVNTDRGLSDYLLNGATIPELLINPGIEKLTILPGGKPLSNSAEHLGSARMTALVKEMKNRYKGDRITIIDGPALLICSDPMVLSRFVDGILLVVEAEKTAADDIKRAMDLLKDKPVLGALFNKATAS